MTEVIQTGRKTPRSLYSSVPRSEGDKKLPEGKKWFMAPGLKVCVMQQ